MFNLGEMWILALNPTILRHNDARYTLLCQSKYTRKLEMASYLFCVILVALAWEVLKL